MSNSISGNVQAVGARIRLTSVNYIDGTIPTMTYSDALGNYTFAGLAAGTYHLTADLGEVTLAPFNVGYSYRTGHTITVVASDITQVNFTPVLLNGPNPGTNAV
jgi:hypothetical protein